MLSRLGAGRHRWIWLAAIPILFWTVVRLFGLERGYPGIALMAFTPYAGIAALLVAGAALGLRNWAAAALAAIAAACLAAAVLPRAIGSETVDPAGHETLTVLSANVHEGDADPDALIALIDRYRPDLLSVQELTPSFAVAVRRAGIEGRLPESMLLASSGASGGGLYSRLPLAPLPFQTRFFFRMPRAAVTMPDGRRLRVAGVHPFPPLSGGADRWQAALASLPTAGAGSPWVLAGDFNGTFDQARFRDVVGRGYRDAGDATAKGLEATFPTMGHRLLPPTIAIDHVLVDRRLGIADYGVEDLPGSDHRAIHAQVVLP